MSGRRTSLEEVQHVYSSVAMYIQNGVGIFRNVYIQNIFKIYSNFHIQNYSNYFVNQKYSNIQKYSTLQKSYSEIFKNILEYIQKHVFCIHSIMIPTSAKALCDSSASNDIKSWEQYPQPKSGGCSSRKTSRVSSSMIFKCLALKNSRATCFIFLNF